MKKNTFSLRNMSRKGAGIAAVSVMALVAAMLLPLTALAASNGTAQYIGEAKAKSIALANAGVTEAQAAFIKAHLDYDDRRVVYDIEFYSGDTEYDYEIDALDGRILEYDRDIEYYSIPGSSAGSSTSTNAAQYIGEAKAKSIALANAGVTEAQAVFIKAHLDYDNRRVVYDVEFYSGDTEYDYEIDAVNGDILESDMEIEYYSIPGNSAASSGSQASLPADTGNYIGEAKAKSVALEHAKVSESQAVFIRTHLDYDDGRVAYEVEFYSGNTEYDYEIDAVSGRILEYDREVENRGNQGNTTAGQSSRPAQSAQPSAGSANYIGEAKAKSIALTNAGITEAQTRRMKVKLDREHGQMVYEVEFKSGQMEYEYEIDAVTGGILESDIEYDD